MEDGHRVLYRESIVSPVEILDSGSGPVGLSEIQTDLPYCRRDAQQAHHGQQALVCRCWMTTVL